MKAQLQQRILNNPKAFYRLCRAKKYISYIDMGECYFNATIGNRHIVYHESPLQRKLTIHKATKSGCITTIGPVISRIVA